MYGVFPECMSVHLCVQCPWKSEDGARSPWTGVADGCEPPWVCWELDLLQTSELDRVTWGSCPTHCKARGCLELLECGEDTDGPFPESSDAKVSWTILGSLQQECCSCGLLEWWAWLRLPLGTKMLKFYRAFEDMSNCHAIWLLCLVI